MKRYSINKNVVVEKFVKTGGGELEENKKNDLLKWLNNSRGVVEQMIHQLNNSPLHNGYRYFYIKYEKNYIPPKTSRIEFNTVNTIEEIPHIGAHIDNNNCFKLYHKIREKHMIDFVSKLQELISTKQFKGKHFNFLSSIYKIRHIGVDEHMTNQERIFIHLLPINEIITYIRDNIGFIFYDNNSNTALVNYEMFNKINAIYPWIIYSIDEVKSIEIDNSMIDALVSDIKLKGPINKTTIGVIDTGFKKGVFFGDLVKSESWVNVPNFSNFEHGTSVTSLIVAHDEINKTVPDGLGNFRVKHFELLGKTGISFFEFSSKIEKIIQQNPDVKIWNISFGAEKTPYRRSISPHGKLFDKLGKKYNVLFIVAAGNERAKNKNLNENRSLNSPADGLNCLSVGSVEINQKNFISRTAYSSRGPILHFEKPEISHFGGPFNHDRTALKVFGEGGLASSSGTSFATPRVARYAGWLLSEGYTIEQIKAELISSTIKEGGDKASVYGCLKISNDYKIELLHEESLSSKNPKYFPIELPEKTTIVKMAFSFLVEPIETLGEEYSIDHIDLSLVWGDSDDEQFERNKRKKTVTKTNGKEYLHEAKLRFDKGKYFNSNVKEYKIRDILKSKSEFINDKKVANPQLYVRARKQSMYDIEGRSVKVGIVIKIYGEFTEGTFEELNNELININIDIDIDA